jgi:ABC-type multidrug transport system permease subunit
VSVARFLEDTLAIAANEFRLFRRNRSAILISLVILPLFFTVALGAGRGSAGTTFYPTSRITIAFVDNDHTIASLRLWKTLTSSPDFRNLIQTGNERAAVASLGLKKYYAVIVIPKGFQGNIDNGHQAQIILYTDDSEPGVSDQISGTLTGYVQNFDPTLEFQVILTPIQKNSVGGVQIVDKSTVYASFDAGLAVVLAVVQIFAVFYEIAGGIAREREEGTFARLVVSPMHMGSMLLGKTLFDLVLSTARTFIVLAFSIYVYGASPNTGLDTILALSLLLALMTMGLGFLVSSMKVGARAVVILEFFLVLSLFAFSGLIIDKELLVGFAQVVANVLPFTYGFDAMRRTILVGRPLLSLTTDLQVIFGAIVGFYGFSFASFRVFRERLAT